MDDRRGVTGWDALVAAGLAAAVAAEAWDRWAELAAGLVLAAVVVVISRQWPLWSLLLGASASLLHLVVGSEFRAWPLLVSAAGCLLAGRRMAEGRPVLPAFAAVAVAGLAAAVAIGDAWRWVEVVGPLLFAGVLPWLVGRYRRLRMALVESGWRHAAQLEREQGLVASEVRLRERARIAQDMHDSLGHELSLLAMRAGALELDGGPPERYRAAVGELRAGLSGAIEQLREVIGVLRDETETASPGSVETVADLVARARSSGVDVELVTTGAAGAAPSVVARAAYRVVQEALTNAVRHAPGAAVTVRLAGGASETLVTVVNGPPPRPGSPPAAGGGRGLAGLAERVRLAGGSLRTGERDGGYEVVARLPGTDGQTEPGGAEPELEALFPPPRPQSGADIRSEAAAFSQARRRARRGLLGAVTVPVALTTAVLLVLFGLRVHEVFNSHLHPVSYEQLRLGQPRTALAGRLPPQQVVGRPDVPEPPVPAGARCEYYRLTTDLLAGPIDVYRLCFAGGLLVDKDLVPGRTP